MKTRDTSSDMYERLAIEMFGKPFKSLPPAERQQVKAVGFGTAYGMKEGVGHRPCSYLEAYVPITEE